MRLMQYNYTVIYIPGKDLVVVDALSRSPLAQSCPQAEELTLEVNVFVNRIIESLPATDDFISKIINEQSSNPICSKLKQFALTEWPTKSNLAIELIPYYQYRHDINFSGNLLLKGTRIIIPPSLHKQVLEFIHEGHQGIVKCKARA
ncbi:hypothetical protein NQ314_020991 [Rhamnusium bicolor]|uniref:Integrase zinc-binding domain-containing protein n=1 Tax=Rhamnusium bicolor TaxID=1586634 RepID=A0AAV8WJA0_9CUCU|nr:hypothetical protein NQ314_020991 [Rhamnusium bicolor]